MTPCWLLSTGVVLLVIGSPANVNSAANGGRVYNGYEARQRQFPYQALMLIQVVPTSLGQEVCGGSIINDKYVVSAAHCFSEREWTTATVYLGITKVSDRKLYKDTVTSANVLVHPRYIREGTVTHDIALVRLNKRIPLSRYPGYLQAILLPNSTANGYIYGTDPSYFDNQRAIVSGWGKTNDSSDSLLPPNLQYQTVNIMPHDECQQFFEQNTQISINVAHICTDKSLSPPAGPCQGDSGGPLALRVLTPKREVNSYLVGLVSFNYGQALPSGESACINPNPAVYVNVAYHTPWIYTVLAVN